MKVYIYALIHKQTGKTVYVGQTYYPINRHFCLGEIGLCILRVADRKTALRIEAQIIRAYKRRGACERNRNTKTSCRVKARAERKKNSRSLMWSSKEFSPEFFARRRQLDLKYKKQFAAAYSNDDL